MNATILPDAILVLSDPRAADASRTGGKASALARLATAGHPVPPGFVVTTVGFERHEGCHRLTPEARAQLGAALADLGGPVAVRSSGVAEDLVGASFAGQYETVLDVRGLDAVEAAIATCLASADAPRVRAYREERGIAAAPMAVLIQRMVPARAAGVAFTAHPVTGERDVVVLSAVRGLGEALVSGSSDAEEWEVKDEPLRRRGVDAVLTRDEARQVSILARAVADGQPTDVEWAITDRADGHADLHLLQARPMTALPDVVSWSPPAPGGFIRTFRLGEWIGAPVTPLFESWILTDLEEQVHQTFEDLAGFATPRPLHVLVNGWYFYGGMNFELRLGAFLRALPRIVRTLLDPRRRKQFLATVPPLAHLGFDAELARWRGELVPALHSVVEASHRDVEAADADALVAIVQAIVDETARQLASIVGVAGYAAKCEGKLFDFWRKHLRDHEGSPLDLVVGADVAPAEHDVEGLDPIFPTLGERGTLPLPMSAEVRERALRARDEAEARALAALPETLRPKLQARITEARRAHAVRLEQTGLLTLGWPVLRRALLRLGEGLALKGAIDDREDVLFLQRGELSALLAGQRITQRAAQPLAPSVRERRATWEHQRQLAPPVVIGKPAGLLKAVFDEITAILHHEEHDAPDALVGMPGSPGRVTATARVVRGIDELHRLQPGEILVAPITTPMWTLAFGRALAVVTDTGSIASHASIVAREHGIPAVVGTGDGTRRIVDGQRITVDGGRGVVRLNGGA